MLYIFREYDNTLDISLMIYSARNCFARKKGKQKESKVTLPLLNVLSKGGKPLSGAWSKQSKTKVGEISSQY